MIFISAQPDSYYFIWQLEIQLKNFSDFDIACDSIHVLVAYDEEKGVNPDFILLSQQVKHLANFFFYPDRRLDTRYTPSIRPHILKQHYAENKWLDNESVFYHDSDIIFTTQLPNFIRMCEDDNWYFSDTRSYLGVDYINSKGTGLLKGMCKAVNIDIATVEKNDHNAGGAQALIKNVNAEFWSQIEEDCINIFDYLDKAVPRLKKSLRELDANSMQKHMPISIWCSDMWALLWNAFKVASVKIDKELDFCWPKERIHQWFNTRIFHNAGVSYHERDRLFYKIDYADTSPYDKHMDFISPEVCSYKYAQKIREYDSSLIYECSDVTFLIPVRIDSSDRLENLCAILMYLTKKMKCNIIVLEADKYQKVPRSIISSRIHYVFVKDEEEVFFREFYNNKLTVMAKTPIIVKYDCDVVVPYSQLFKAISYIRKGESDLCYPYDGSFLKVYGVLRNNFISNQDIIPLDKYVKKDYYNIPSVGGCAVFNKNSYIQMGMENTNFYGWGFEDQEINKRALILGMNVKRVNGPLYHLEHERGLNSNFADRHEYLKSYREYIKICNCTAEEIRNYIANWHIQ